jgi:hypothetical protein
MIWIWHYLLAAFSFLSIISIADAHSAAAFEHFLPYISPSSQIIQTNNYTANSGQNIESIGDTIEPISEHSNSASIPTGLTSTVLFDNSLQFCGIAPAKSYGPTGTNNRNTYAINLKAARDSSRLRFNKSTPEAVINSSNRLECLPPGCFLRI